MTPTIPEHKMTNDDSVSKHIPDPKNRDPNSLFMPMDIDKEETLQISLLQKRKVFANDDFLPVTLEWDTLTTEDNSAKNLHSIKTNKKAKPAPQLYKKSHILAQEQY